MGRINLTPLRVRKQALANLEAKRTTVRPLWMDIVGDIPPSQVLVRPLPIEQPYLEVRTKTRLQAPKGEGNNASLPEPETYVSIKPKSKPRKNRKNLKPSRMFCPIPIRYEEDTLRKRFFTDHPWELARPRVVLETSGNSHAGADWSTGLLQPNIALSGESVVQRQLHLLQNVPDITVSRAYDIARKEFYDLRRQEDVQRRVAAEEARATGTVFGKDVLQWSMEVEDRQYDDWERWSRAQVIENLQKTAAFEGGTMPAEEEQLVDAAPAEQETGGSAFALEAGRGAGQRGKKVVADTM
jgi:small subunit ribosomal protein S23